MTDDKRVRWTDERVTILRELYAAGKSASQIAVALDVTRNSVIGKIDRLDLPPRERPPPVGRPRRARPRRPKKPIEENPTPVRLLDLEPHHCRWPVSGERAETMFCGGTAIEDRSYCLRHCRMVFRTEPRVVTEAESEKRRRTALKNYRMWSAA